MYCSAIKKAADLEDVLCQQQGLVKMSLQRTWVWMMRRWIEVGECAHLQGRREKARQIIKSFNSLHHLKDNVVNNIYSSVFSFDFYHRNTSLSGGWFLAHHFPCFLNGFIYEWFLILKFSFCSKDPLFHTQKSVSMDGISVACQTGQCDPQQLCSESSLCREQIFISFGFWTDFKKQIYWCPP